MTSSYPNDFHHTTAILPSPSFHSQEQDILMQMGIGYRKVSFFLSSILFTYLLVSRSCFAINHISSTQSITDGETLTSVGEVFELGFFSPGNSSNRYVGRWYMKITDRKVVWVANREKPLSDFSGVLTISRDGNLVLMDGRQNPIWSTNVTFSSNNSVAQLFDDGNLVLNPNNSQQRNYLWESFNHPTDTFLQNMKLGLNTRTKEKHFLTSWKSDDDPSPGNFICGVSHPQIPQTFVWNRSVPYWRSGEWNGFTLIGVPEMNSTYFNGFLYLLDNQGGVYFSFSMYNNMQVSFLTMGSSGILNQISWNEGVKKWTEDWRTPDDQCDFYGKCGPFGTCNVVKLCRCLQGFRPNYIEEWRKENWSGGCVRRTQLPCKKNNSNLNEEKGDKFLKLRGLKLPDFSEYLNVANATQCQDECSRNCSCLAYAFVEGINCMVWGGDLIGIREFPVGGEVLFLRLAHSEFGGKKLKTYIIVLITIAGFIIVSALAFILYWLKAKQRGKKKELQEITDSGKIIESPEAILLKGHAKGSENIELPLFDFGTIKIATNYFANKLGEGGFGPVYKGTLQDGQEIAVKRLSRSSGQGIEEFKNELKLISKLQHRNLVRLLGFCIDGEEKILVYEYMPHKSLDAFLFDPTRRVLLDWGKRFNIVDGIARGLLYLHRDSRLRVIHRDLKASNILLDEDMNPKISDFGTARIFGGKQTLANTNRVVGTYGYMSPEYAMEGTFSEKSDVFSFGVLLLEIVSSKRNTSFYQHEQSLNLLGYAWRLWNEDKVCELMDPSLVDSYSPLELMRCIHVGLLCVQEHAIDRPNMSTIVFMLGSETTLPTPKQPAFTFERTHVSSDLPANVSSISINTATITTVGGR